MGGGPDKEHLLIIHWDPEPKEFTDEIRRRFPYIEVTYFCLENYSQPLEDQTQRVPKRSQRDRLVLEHLRRTGDLFKSATLLVTLASLPAKQEDAPNLKLIHLFSAGVDHWVNHPIFKDSDITITTSSGIHGPPIAEWCLMTTLAFSKHYSTFYELQKQHVWGKHTQALAEGGDWVGKRVGIAGYGSIGRQVANIFHSLGSTILAYTASPRDTAESRKDSGYIVPGTGDPDGTIPTAWYSGGSKTALHTFLSQSLDILVITLPLTDQTRHLFGAEEFSILSRTNTTSTSSPAAETSSDSSPSPPTRNQHGSNGAFLLNISRGAILDQPALIHALNTEQLRGAALDVADPEPLPKDDPLWDAKNLIITPHISGLGREYMGRAYDVFMLNLARKERGEKLVNVVQRGKGY